MLFNLRGRILATVLRTERNWTKEEMRTSRTLLQNWTKDDSALVQSVFRGNSCPESILKAESTDSLID